MIKVITQTLLRCPICAGTIGEDKPHCLISVCIIIIRNNMPSNDHAFNVAAGLLVHHGIHHNAMNTSMGEVHLEFM